MPTGSLLDLEMLSEDQGWAVGGATSLGEFSTILRYMPAGSTWITQYPGDIPG
ncbi:MAG TPA: hypothetical protein VJL34_12165 [Anaerolineales bacterium]|nr:hypothetical protein [Anaerolineales bacterium]